jgi:deoxyribonuclease V
MKFSRLHSWTQDVGDAVRIQERLRHFVEHKCTKKEFPLIAGADVAYSKRDDSVFGAVVVMRFPELVTVDKARAQSVASFPYKPELFTFREGPVLLKAIQRLQSTPDVFLIDGNGIAHELGIGIASHLGILLDTATIGCAKKHTIGEFREPENEINATSPLLLDGKEVGVVLRNRVDVKPLIISVGHKIDLDTALEIVMLTTRGYRLPEPMRVAHILSNKMRRSYDERFKSSGSRKPTQSK